MQYVFLFVMLLCISCKKTSQSTSELQSIKSSADSQPSEIVSLMTNAAPFKFQECAGVLVAPGVILTAARCYQASKESDDTDKKLFIIASFFRDGRELHVRATSWKVHEHIALVFFDHQNFPEDISLKTVSVEKNNVASFSNVWTYAAAKSRIFGKKLDKKKLDIQQKDTCLPKGNSGNKSSQDIVLDPLSIKAFSSIPQKFFCSNEGETCHGYPGMPIMQDRDNSTVLVGLTLGSIMKVFAKTHSSEKSSTKSYNVGHIRSCKNKVFHIPVASYASWIVDQVSR